MEISKDEHERAKHRSRRMYETDMYSDIATAEEKGELRGELKKALEIAKNLKSIGTDIGVIAQATGLTVDEISKL